MRLIDSDARKEGIKELKQSPWYNNDINPSWRQGIKDAVHVVETLCIDEEPTVDAVPVRHGKWIDRNGAIVAPFWERYECSECGARSDNSNYCPNCGARMDEE